MGLCVDSFETPHDLTFEVRGTSVILFFKKDEDGDLEFDVEVNKSDLLKLKGLLNDPAWAPRLTGAPGPTIKGHTCPFCNGSGVETHE